jgi:hypothetical protein
MKVWIVVVALLLLAFLILRERYTNYEEALKDVGQTAGYIIPKCEAGYTLNPEKSECKKTLTDGTVDKKTPTCPSGSHYFFRETEGNCEPDLRTSPSENTTEPTCPMDYTFNRDEGACEKRNADGSVKRATGTCPEGRTINDRGRCIKETPEVLSPTVSSYLRGSGAAPVGAASASGPASVSGMGTRAQTGTCPDGYTLKHSDAEKIDFCLKLTDPTCPSGYTIDPNGLGCTNAEGDIKTPTCSVGTFNPGLGKCRDTVRPTNNSPPAGSTSSSVSVTTGGSSGNLIGPTSGGSGLGKNVWGPIFSGVGESAAASGGDSTRTREYPELLGGNSGKPSARIAGVGIVPPSQPGFGLDLGVLPSTASLGTDPLARYLPFSRQPGDMDVVSDPYRLANSFSTKNFSSQKDPIPFLTDFSAFYK